MCNISTSVLIMDKIYRTTILLVIILMSAYITVSKLQGNRENMTVQVLSSYVIQDKGNNTVLSYNSAAQLSNRRQRLQEWCKENPKLHKTISSYKTKYISRYGKSRSGVSFWACFTPKCASQSFTAALLHASGFIKPNQAFNGTILNRGRNKCQSHDKTCLKEYKLMPSNLSWFSNSSLVKAMFARDPMDRLVSVWKNKLYSMRLQYYYKKATYGILKNQHQNVPKNGRLAFDQGYRLSFKDFVEWLVVGVGCPFLFFSAVTT